MAKAADELPPTRRVQQIAEIFQTFRNPDKETVLTPWRVVNMHLSDTLGGYCFLNEDFDQDNPLDTPRLVEQEDITANLLLNPDVRILEMNSKSGLYPLYMAYSIYAMRLNGNEEKMPLEETQKLWRQVLEDHIFVLCRTKMAVSITRRTLAGYQNWPVNAICLSKLVEERMKDQQRLSRKLTNPATWGKEGKRMDFNAVIGNPPYQITGGSGGTNDAPVYQNFVDLAKITTQEYTSMITPARWFSGGRENLLSDFRSGMLNSQAVRYMYVFPVSRNLFPTVEIKGGLCYFMIDSEYAGDCRYTMDDSGGRRTYHRKLNDFDILIRDPILASIVKKVGAYISSDKDAVSSMISSDTPFGIPTNPKDSKKGSITLYDSQNDQHNTLLYYLDKMKRATAYIDRSLIVKNAGDIDKAKVLIPKAGGSGSDPYVLSKPEYAPKNSVCSQTYLYVAFADDNEAKNFISYLKTRFLRILVSAVKVSQDAMSKTYRFVPKQDFSKPWTDAELYKKYGLTAEEIAFIEAMIRPME